MTGQINLNPIESVKTKRMSLNEYLSLKDKPLILYTDKVLQHIADNDFVISGLGYGDCEDHYFRVQAAFVDTVTETVVVNIRLSELLSSKDVQQVPKKPKFTYIMFDSANGYFKIGRSANPKVRESTLQAEKPSIDLVAIIEKDIEEQLHGQFKAYRVRGEWFKLTWDMVLDEIAIDWDTKFNSPTVNLKR